MSDTDAIDAALVATLEADAQLQALMATGASPEPPFVFFEFAPPGRTKFVLVFQEDHLDEYSMGEHAYEVPVYAVMACDKSTSGATAKSAGQRIQAVLHDQPLTITGYRHMATLRQGRIRETKLDEDTDERWQHRGGRYAVWAAPNS